MFTLQGKYGIAKVFATTVEQTTISQIINMLNQPFCHGSTIRIMPDTHPGDDCTIGTTMSILDKVVPNLVSGDIGCGMLTVKLQDAVDSIDMAAFDKAIRKYVPSGCNIHKEMHPEHTSLDCKKLRLYGKQDANISEAIAYRDIGTLGGGNHFAELDTDDENHVYLVIHTGSRHIGKAICNYYQNLASEKLPSTPKKFAWLEGQDMADYLHDMKMIQQFAMENRATIAKALLTAMHWTEDSRFDTIHNYIDTKHMILRKGAVSAQKGEKLLIPINMRDGSLICVGKGNADFNYSAPHGAGRVMSRAKAKESITMDEFKASMKGIWSSSVVPSTIDESPMAYKPMEEIVDNIQDTVDILAHIKPIYNFKASEG